MAMQFIKYIFVASAAFCVDYALLFVLTDLIHWYYLISAATSFILAVLVSYILSVNWVFPKSSYSKLHEFLIFILIGAIGLFANLIIMFYFTDLLRFHYMSSKIISTGFIHFWNFYGRKYVLYT